MRHHKAKDNDIDLSKPVELVVLAVAEHIFEKMLWLNPQDNQGVRFLIDEVKGKTAWEDRENE